MLARLFSVYIQYTANGQDKVAPNSVMIHHMAGGVFSVRLYLCLFLCGTAQASCPSGFSARTGATGGIFATESTGAGDRVRCFSNEDTNSEVWEFVQSSSACSSPSWFTLCNQRASRCAAAGGRTTTVNWTIYCKVCNAGAIRSGDACNKCGGNQYRELGTNNVCQSCAGDTVSRPGSTSRTDCLESGCESCRVGTYNAVTGRTVCEKCPAGTFDEQTGQQVCTSCPAGKYFWPCVHVCAMQYFVVQTIANAITYHAPENGVWFPYVCK